MRRSWVVGRQTGRYPETGFEEVSWLDVSIGADLLEAEFLLAPSMGCSGA
jgi:hypothetical protein